MITSPNISPNTYHTTVGHQFSPIPFSYQPNEERDQFMIFTMLTNWAKEIDFFRKELKALQRLLIRSRTEEVDTTNIEIMETLSQFKLIIKDLSDELHSKNGLFKSEMSKYEARLEVIHQELFLLYKQLKSAKLKILNQLIQNYPTSIY